MNRRTLAELMAVDASVARFGPLGLMTDRRLTDDATIDHLQDLVIGLDLPPAVPNSVREHFDALRHLHIYGAFQPDFFAIVDTEASLMLEHALGARFIEWFGGKVPLVHLKTREAATVETGDFSRLDARFRDDWRLAGDDKFNGSLKALLRWARANDLTERWLGPIWQRQRRWIQIAEQTKPTDKTRLPPDWSDRSEDQRQKWWETDFRPVWESEYLDNERELRNLLSHRTSRIRLTSVDSARSLQALYVIIGSIWSDVPVDPTANE
jgi:hypothetical protein